MCPCVRKAGGTFVYIVLSMISCIIISVRILFPDRSTKRRNVCLQGSRGFTRLPNSRAVNSGMLDSLGIARH